jgi:hypothetical protein
MEKSNTKPNAVPFPIEISTGDASLFTRLGQIRKALLYATSIIQRTLFLAEWRFLELETVLMQIATGDVAFHSKLDVNPARFLTALSQVYKVRQVLSDHLKRKKLLPLSLASWDAAPALITLNLALVMRLYNELADLDDKDKPSLHTILEWLKICTATVKELTPLLKVVGKRFLISQHPDETPGRDDAFFNTIRILNTIDFEEEEKCASCPSCVSPLLIDSGDTEDGPEVVEVVEMKKEKKESEDDHEKAKKMEKTTDNRVFPDTDFNYEEVVAYMNRKWTEAIAQEGVMVYDSVTCEAVEYASYCSS